MKPPFILIFDIDGTIVGDLGYCLKENKVLEEIYKKCIVNTELAQTCFKSSQMDIKDELKNGLMRPNVIDFIQFCDKKFKNVEVFFYTNSSYDWAQTILLPNIENVLGCKVNRPIFTRENSIGWVKTIANIYPSIIKSLVNRYPILKNEKSAAKVFNDRLLFIDDLKDNLHDYKERQIQCPEYKVVPFYDICEKITTKYKLPSSVFDNKDVLEVMNTNEIPIYNKNGSIYQQSRDFAYIQHLYNSKRAEVINKDCSGDTFFLDLIKHLEKVEKLLTNDDIAKINKIFNPKDIKK